MEEIKVEIEKLINGEIAKIVVPKEDFFDFRKVWSEHEKKDGIIGEAQLGGSLIYSYSEAVKK